MHDREALRADLAAAQAGARRGGQYGRDATMPSLAISSRRCRRRTVEAESRSRENEVLREKQVNLSIDLDKALKREAEGVRKTRRAVGDPRQRGGRAYRTAGVARQERKGSARGFRWRSKRRRRSRPKWPTKPASWRPTGKRKRTQPRRDARPARRDAEPCSRAWTRPPTRTSEATGEIARLKAELSDLQSRKAGRRRKTVGARMTEHES